MFLKKIIFLAIFLGGAHVSLAMNTFKSKFTMFKNKVFNNTKNFGNKTFLNDMPKKSFASLRLNALNKSWKKYALFGGVATIGYGTWKCNKDTISEDTISNENNLSTDTPVNSSDLKTTFNVIQGIHKLAAKTAQDAKKHGTKIDLGVKGWPGSNPFHHQTKQGLYLATDIYPELLYTPWGEVRVLGGGPLGSNIDIFFNEFRKNMKLKFVRNVCENSYNIEFYKENEKTPIDRKDLKKYRGTDTNIKATHCGCSSIYEIESFNGIKLPKAEFLEQKNYTDYESTKASWKKFMTDYAQDESKKSH